jgi:hypothetical protein
MRPAIEAGLMLLAGAEKAFMRPVLDRSRKSIYETASNPLLRSTNTLRISGEDDNLPARLVLLHQAMGLYNFVQMEGFGYLNV